MADIPSSFTAIDLSSLPAPDAVEQRSYEQILAEGAVEVEALHPGFDITNEADPAVAVMQVFAHREMLLRARINDAVRSVMVAFSEKTNLDQIAANFGVFRLTITPENPDAGTPAIMESDPDFRRRLVLSPEGYSTAGPEGAYIYHALTADPNVLDASAYGPEETPGTVIVTVLSRDGNGTASPELCGIVADYLTPSTRRPLTDKVIVQAASILEYAIDIEITTFAGPDRAIVQTEAEKAVETYRQESFRLGRDITHAGLIAAAHRPGVQNTKVISPPADIVRNRTQAAYCTGAVVRFVGLGE